MLGGGQKTVTYSYTADFAIGLCEGPISAIVKIWADGKLIYDMSPLTAAAGTTLQMPGTRKPLCVNNLQTCPRVPAVSGEFGAIWKCKAQIVDESSHAPVLDAVTFEVTDQWPRRQASEILAIGVTPAPPE